MLGHFLIALAFLTLFAWIDLRTRRIPNRLLLTALTSHALYWGATAHSPSDVITPAIVFVVVVTASASWDRSRKFLLSAIGMGDIKLVAYLLVFAVPYLDFGAWLFSMSIASVITAILLLATIHRRNGRRDGTIPLAPVLLVGTLFALMGQL